MRILLSIIILSFATISFGQSPYELDWKKERYYFGTSIGMYATAGLLEWQYVNQLSESEIFELDRANINSFDRKATFYLSSEAGKGSDYLKYISYPLPFLFAFNKDSKSDFKTILVLYGETLTLTSSLTSLTKRIVLRPRPLVFNELESLDQKRKKSSRYAFFSGHTSVTTANCFFAAKVFSDYFPESKWKPVVWSGAVLISSATGYLRVRAGKHYPTDVITGFLVGGAIGYLIPQLHKKRTSKGLSLTPMNSGFHLSYRF